MASCLQMCLLTVNDQLDLVREQQPLLQGWTTSVQHHVILFLHCKTIKISIIDAVIFICITLEFNLNNKYIIQNNATFNIQNAQYNILLCSWSAVLCNCILQISLTFYSVLKSIFDSIAVIVCHTPVKAWTSWAAAQIESIQTLEEDKLSTSDLNTLRWLILYALVHTYTLSSLFIRLDTWMKWCVGVLNHAILWNTVQVQWYLVVYGNQYHDCVWYINII